VIVVDVNVVAYFLIEGDKTAAARDLLRRDPDWRLPALWRHEYLNVLATYAREGGATVAEARSLWRRGVELFAAGEQGVDMESALALAAENRISAYDAQYITLARQLQTVCVTEDQRLLGQFPALARSMQAFGEPE
jgi:predicted nucleic acid-binding protein